MRGGEEKVGQTVLTLFFKLSWGSCGLIWLCQWGLSRGEISQRDSGDFCSRSISSQYLQQCSFHLPCQVLCPSSTWQKWIKKKDLKTGQLGMSSLDAVLFEAGLCQVWLFKTTDVEKVSPDAFGSSWWPLCVWIIVAAPGTTVSCHSHGNNGFKIELCCRSITTASYGLTHS